MVESLEKISNMNLKVKFNLPVRLERENDRNTSSLDVIKRLQIRTKTTLVRSNQRTRTNIQGQKISTSMIKDMIKKLSNKGDTFFFDSRSNSNSQGSLDKSLKAKDSNDPDKNVNLFLQVTREMETKFIDAMKENFIDHSHNLPENYEEYVVQNLKVIKRMQFFFNQIDYDCLYNKKRTEIGLKFKFDYNSPYILFDLDETLIHSEVFQEANAMLYDKIIEIDYAEDDEIKVEKLGIFIRPYAEEFLSWASQIFKLVLYTAAENKYAVLILKAFDLEKYFEYILDREYTIDVKGFLIKDVTILNSVDKLNCVIIDNNIFSFAATLAQGILISSFYKDKEDIELRDLKTYFEETIIPNIEMMVSTNSEYYMYQDLMEKIEFENEESN